MTSEQKLALAIQKRFDKTGDYSAAMDELSVLRAMDNTWSHGQCAELRKSVTEKLKAKKDDKLFGILRDTLKYDATVNFDCFMRFMEWEREPEKRFYLPRRKIIKSMWVDHIQDLVDGKLDLLTLSCPPGSGKSTLGMFLLAFVMGRDPDKPNLASAHSGTLTQSFYKGVLTFISDPEYTYREIFPYDIADKDGMQQTIDLDKKHRFSTLTCRAINASLTGATRCEGLLYMDDMCSGIEEATNPERLDSLWNKITNDLLSRRKMNCPTIQIATRWSVRDPIGRQMMLYEGNPRCRFITCPALNDEGESNFDYEYNVGFDTKYFMDMKANLDDVSWRALFMNEPIEREGLLFPKDELRYYYELPKNEDGSVKDPDYIISIADTKDKGKDYGVLPVGFVYGEDIYIEDVVCNNGKPEIVEAEFIEILLRNRVQLCRFESNAAGGKVADKVAGEIRKRGGITHITQKFTLSNKETRIQVNSPVVRNKMLFKAVYDKTKPYGIFMNQLTSYVLSGKNKHDDVPDALSMLAEYWEGFNGAKVQVVARPF